MSKTPLEEFLDITSLKNNSNYVQNLLKTVNSKNITVEDWNTFINQLVETVSKDAQTYLGFNKVLEELQRYIPIPDWTFLLEKGIGNTSIQQLGNISGIKGLYWKDIEFGTASDKIYLSTACHYSDGTIKFDTEDLEFDINQIGWSKKTDSYSGDVISIHNDTKYLNCANILDLGKDGNGSYIVVTKLPFSNKVYDDYDKGEFTVTDNAVFVQEKPDKGLVDFGMGAVALGEETQAVNYMAFSGGWKNKSLGQFSTTFGRGNITGYCGLTFGRGNENQGDHSIVGGAYNKNFDKGYASAVFGDGNENYSDKSFIAGRYNKNLNSSSLGNALFGGSNENYGTHALLSGEGNKNSHANGLGNILIGRTNEINTDWGNSGAMGENNKIYANGSFAFGAHNVIPSKCHNSFVTGLNNKVSGNSQAVVGKYNDDTHNTALFIVGNGDNDTNRKNAFEVLPDGIRIGNTKVTESQLIKILALLN